MSFHEAGNFQEQPAKESPKFIKFELDGLMENIQKKTNEEFGEDILNPDASLNMRLWGRSAEFPDGYAKEIIKSDEKMVRDKKVLFSGASNLPAGEERERTVASWEERRKLSRPALLEKADNSRLA